jgi:hypothetical protein
MAAAAAAVTTGGITLTAVQKGEQGNLITVAVVSPAAGTGAASLVETANAAVVTPAFSGAVITSTLSGVKAAFNTGRLVVASGGTDGFTGAAFAATALTAGASGASGYDDLAAAQSDGWALTNKVNASYGDVDVLEKVDRRKGGRVRVAAKAATGATNVVQSAYNEENRRARLGYPRSLMGASGSQAFEYVTTV